MRNYMSYDNFLTEIKQDSAKLETALSKHRLSFPSLRDYEVENHKFTPFVYTYMELVLESGWMPFQSELVKTYLAEHGAEFRSLYERKGEYIKARIRRCHPSYARDLHFGILCRESGLFDDVIYNPDLDVRQGIDLLIIKDAKFYGIHNFTDTAKAKAWREKKDARRADTNEFIKEVDFTVFKNDGFACGDYYLYGPEQVKRLAATLA